MKTISTSMQFPWRLLSKYTSRTHIDAMRCHNFGAAPATLYACSPGDVVECGGEYWLVKTNYAYDIVCERLFDGVVECKLPTTGCVIIGNVSIEESDYAMGQNAGIIRAS
jgi:hypothetical protein